MWAKAATTQQGQLGKAKEARDMDLWGEAYREPAQGMLGYKEQDRVRAAAEGQGPGRSPWEGAPRGKPRALGQRWGLGPIELHAKAEGQAQLQPHPRDSWPTPHSRCLHRKCTVHAMWDRLGLLEGSRGPRAWGSAS